MSEELRFFIPRRIGVRMRLSPLAGRLSEMRTRILPSILHGIWRPWVLGYAHFACLDYLFAGKAGDECFDLEYGGVEVCVVFRWSRL